MNTARVSCIINSQLINIPKIAITVGEPAGIGPDILLQMAQEQFNAYLVVFADPNLLQQRASQLGLPLNIAKSIQPHEPACLNVVPINVHQPTVCGQLNVNNSAYVLETIQQACQACLDGHFNALVTAPVHKGIINDAGIKFTGHTEFLAHQCASQNVVMMLARPELRVALATTHLPLSQISSAITSQRLEAIIKTLHVELQSKLGLSTPRILVCGLNPHAGEDGHLGTEEITTIIPTLNKLRAEGLQLQGPVPADSAFLPEILSYVDVVLAMYHDQGLPMVKQYGFAEVVNITLGLPFLRVSVGHGTALNLAGTGKANYKSLSYAVQTCIDVYST
ncbi:4-hydroxythreonine-4-phosphate dehydrogenase PdxA [Candidatus Halobeggiatoa sp. HSG11]|nr:4-hydroxythreonine-4-phosphate dehydrogenase PdxA [Candidatus Halobeggiatoa sp. HSG11]